MRLPTEYGGAYLWDHTVYSSSVRLSIIMVLENIVGARGEFATLHDTQKRAIYEGLELS